MQCGSCQKFFRTNHTFNSHLGSCGGNKEQGGEQYKDISETNGIDENFEDFSEELLLGEEFDLDEKGELELLKIREEMTSFSSRDDETDLQSENIDEIMKEELPNDTLFRTKEVLLAGEEFNHDDKSELNELGNHTIGSNEVDLKTNSVKIERSHDELFSTNRLEEEATRPKEEYHEKQEIVKDEMVIKENPSAYEENVKQEIKKKEYFEKGELHKVAIDTNIFKKPDDNVFSAASMGSLDDEPEISKNKVDVSMESIEIVDSDDEKDGNQLNSGSVFRDLNEEEEKKQPKFVMDVKKPKKRKIKGSPFNPKPCHYCVEECYDRIELAKHMISDHWGEVYEAHGGGRKPNSTYYQIEDSRVLRPKPPPMSARTSFHMKGLAGADAVNRAYQATSALQPNPAWLQKLTINKQLARNNLNESQNQIGMKSQLGNQNQISMKSQIGIQNHVGNRIGMQNQTAFRNGFAMKNQFNRQKQMSNQQLANFTNYINRKQVPLKKVNKGPHNPVWFGNTPKRNILPKPSPGEVLDLTTDDDEVRCEVCEDDFNWPDENHECPLKRKKKKLDLSQSSTGIPEKGGLTILKEKIFNKRSTSSLKSDDGGAISKRNQLEVSVQKIPKSTQIMPVRNPPTRVQPGRKLPPTKPPPTRIQPTRSLPVKNIPDRALASRIMPSRRVKTY